MLQEKIMAAVYIADEDSEQGARLCVYLMLNGFDSSVFSSLSDLQRSVRRSPPDAIVMELDFTDGSGLPYIQAVRVSSRISVVVTSNRKSESDRILAFELGCDDYVVKPYSMKELSLRLSAILRRRSSGGVTRHKAFFAVRSSRLSIDWDSHLLLLDGAEIQCTASEWKIITFLMDNAGALVTRARLLSACFPECLESSDRIIDTHIKNIRAKLEPYGTDWIETVRGYGYRFLGVREGGM